MAGVAAVVELYGAAGCPYTADMREHLLWHRVSFIEYDVEADDAARERWRALIGEGSAIVPVLVENGQVKERGWRGRGCTLTSP